MATPTIRIKDGVVTYVYDDALVGLGEALGVATVTRASHVEPAPGPGVAWTADMAPSGGPVLGPFPTRAEALAAERAWLTKHRGL